MEMTMRQYILDNFETAIEKRYIQPFYQPVIRTISGKLCSFEALARWVDPHYGIISPAQFIPVLEKEKLIHLLDSCIIRQVCARIRRTMDSGRIPIPVSVNLSRLDFVLCDIFAVTDEAVSFYRIPHDYIYIEITESIIAESEGLMQSVVSRFRSAGYQVWMDDFGSGFSSLNILKDYDFDELKLDMNFLRSFHRRSRTILTSMIRMAKDINMHTLAEGVETEEQLIFLRDSGCEKVQGYYFGKPMPYDDVMHHMEEKKITIEQPVDRKYYDDIGKVDFLSAVPFMEEKERKRLTSARQLNSIPLALVEVQQESFCLSFSNLAFEEMATESGLSPDLFRRDMAGTRWPFSVIPARIVSLLDYTKNGTEGRMVFVSHEEYYELRAKCVARTRHAFSVLLKMNNLSKASEAASTSRLDEGLRQIYTLFERITMIDLNTDTLTPLYVSAHEDLMSGRAGLKKLSKEFAEKYIYPDDREAFLEFSDVITLDQRIKQAGDGFGYISRIFRTAVGHGNYMWKGYTLLRVRKGCFVELIRDVHKEVLLLELNAKKYQESLKGDFSADMLWRNLVKSDILGMFWKDKKRRFVGVNQGFLDYYGFESEAVLVGKTDEDMGWHIRPDQYVGTELQIIQEGVTTRYVPGNCMREGQNREILASKMPLYDVNGEIAGLLGYFIDREQICCNDVRGADTLQKDSLTGLLNARGIAEAANEFEEQYYRRRMDFVRMHVSFSDFNVIIQQYGYDFADKMIIELGDRLRRAVGTFAAIGRYNGHHFVILYQIKNPGDLDMLRETVRDEADGIREIDGIPVTFYLAIGDTLYSEAGGLEEQKKKSELRMMADHDTTKSIESFVESSAEIFSLYDDLPISYAVYEVIRDGDGKACDAILFYANHKFEERSGKEAADMLGRRTRDLFPSLEEDWYDKADRAAYKGETVVDNIYFVPTGKHYYMTASQVIRTGFCCFTYQEIDNIL